MQVIKRNGELQKYDSQKIASAIISAFNSAEVEITEEVYQAIQKITDKVEFVGQGKNISVEVIQDIIEDSLMVTYPMVAKNFIKHRFLHQLARNKYKELMVCVQEKLEATNVANQNANIDEYSFGGRLGETAELVSKRYALEYLISPIVAKNHLENRVYIHDLGHYALGDHNCLSIPFDDLLANGFNTRQTDIRPAASLSTALQLVAVIFQLQSLNEFGGVSATHLDYTLEPYFRISFVKHLNRVLRLSKLQPIDSPREKVKITPVSEYKGYGALYDIALEYTLDELHQSVEGLFHNLNTLQSRSGNQLELWLNRE